MSRSKSMDGDKSKYMCFNCHMNNPWMKDCSNKGGNEIFVQIMVILDTGYEIDYTQILTS